jgi:hypothetical protein
MAAQIISIVIIAVIAFFVLRNENRKQKKYFGRKVAPTRKEKKILERYRQEYELINKDLRLAKLDRDKWELEDIAKSATEIVYDSPIPTKAKRQSLKEGTVVKLKFMLDEGGEIEIERMWVKVKGEDKGLYFAELDNDPFSDVLKPGQLIWFHPNHVFQVDTA